MVIQQNIYLLHSDAFFSDYVLFSDKLPPPEFEIEGIYGSNRLQILTTPVLFKHTQTSLNCWYGNKLRYEIMFFYGYNGSLSEMVSCNFLTSDKFFYI